MKKLFLILFIIFFNINLVNAGPLITIENGGGSGSVPVTATQEEVEAGTETDLRSLSPALLKAAIDSLGATTGWATDGFITSTTQTVSIGTTTFLNTPSKLAMFSIDGSSGGVPYQMRLYGDHQEQDAIKITTTLHPEVGGGADGIHINPSFVTQASDNHAQLGTLLVTLPVISDENGATVGVTAGIHINGTAPTIGSTGNYAIYDVTGAPSLLSKLGLGDDVPANRLFSVGNENPFQVDTNGTITNVLGITSQGDITCSKTASDAIIKAVTSQTGSGGTLQANANTAQTYIIANGSASTGTIAGLSKANLIHQEVNQASAYVMTTVNSDTAPMVWAPDRTEKMRLTSTGRLGIGLTNPAVSLEVAGQTAIQKQVITKSTGATLTASEMRNSVILCTAALTLTLPDTTAAMVGSTFTVISTTAAVVSVDPDASDQIVLGGVALTAGNKVSSDGVAYTEATYTITEVGTIVLRLADGVWINGGA